MKKIIGTGMILGGIALGIYVGIYVMLMGGIGHIVEFFKNGYSASELAWGIVKIFFAGTAGVLSPYALVLPGIAFFVSKK